MQRLPLEALFASSLQHTADKAGSKLRTEIKVPSCVLSGPETAAYIAATDVKPPLPPLGLLKPLPLLLPPPPHTVSQQMVIRRRPRHETVRMAAARAAKLVGQRAQAAALKVPPIVRTAGRTRAASPAGSTRRPLARLTAMDSLSLGGFMGTPRHPRYLRRRHHRCHHCHCRRGHRRLAATRMPPPPRPLKCAPLPEPCTTTHAAHAA